MVIQMSDGHSGGRMLTVIHSLGTCAYMPNTSYKSNDPAAIRDVSK